MAGESAQDLVPASTAERILPQVSFDDGPLAGDCGAPEGIDEGWPPEDAFRERWDAGVESFELHHCAAATVWDRILAGRRWGIESAATAYQDRDEEMATDLGRALIFTSVEGTSRVVVSEKGDDRVDEVVDRWEFGPALPSAVADVVHFQSTNELSVDLRCRRERHEIANLRSVQAYAAWIYASTVVDADGPNFIDPAPDWRNHEWTDEERSAIAEVQAIESWSRDSVNLLLELPVPAQERLWGDALAWSREAGEEDLQWEIYRRYRPMGQCSHDTRPQELALEFADFCGATGRVGCRVAVLVDQLAYRVDRVSDMWIGGRPVSYESPAGAIADIVEPKWFFPGLLPAYSGADGNLRPIGLQFFALGVQGSSFAEDLLKTLLAWAVDDDLDTLNRHRAAMAWVWTRVYEVGDAQAVIAEMLATEGIPEFTRIELRKALASS